MSYGAQDLLDYAPVAKQNLTTGVMSVAEMCKAGGAERQCLPQSVGRLPTERKIGDKTGNNGRTPPATSRSRGPPRAVCATRGSPTPKQFEAVFAEIGRVVGRQLG